MRTVLAALLAGSASLLLAACGEEAPVVDVAADHSDPLMDGALADHIMVDPDMVARNGANQAASLGTGDGSIPLPDAGPEAVAAARAEAIALVGGSAAMPASWSRLTSISVLATG
jgi:hypothetical protein